MDRPFDDDETERAAAGDDEARAGVALTARPDALTWLALALVDELHEAAFGARRGLPSAVESILATLRAGVKLEGEVEFWAVGEEVYVNRRRVDGAPPDRVARLSGLMKGKDVGGFKCGKDTDRGDVVDLMVLLVPERAPLRWRVESFFRKRRRACEGAP